MLTLRPYQQAAVDAVYRYLREHDDNPCVVIPTAGGKTPVLATICRDAALRWQGRALVVTHVKELLEQAVDKLRRVCPELPVGVYSAGLRRRDTSAPVIVAGIQSVYKRACDLDAFDLVIVDEAHTIPLEGEGMYRQFLADARKVNPHLRVIGLTATPFRLRSGPICQAAHDGGILNAVCYEIGVRALITDGYLCPLVTRAGRAKADTGQLHVRGGEFVADEVATLMDQDGLVEAACDEIVDLTRDRQSCLLFAAGVAHGRHVARALERRGIECGFVCGETRTDERDELLARFRGDGAQDLFQRPRPLKYLCNVNVLTTGFDAPNIDCVVLLRPTMSAGLYYQMVGRGFRLHPGKKDCLVLDYGGNVVRHGPVDQIKIKERTESGGSGDAPAKECPACRAVVAAGLLRCPECGHEFPPPERARHDAQATQAGILSGQVTTTTLPVMDVVYSVHVKRGAADDDPRTVRVDYQTGWHDSKSEWICIEHSGYARWKAEQWWRRRSPDPVPRSADRAVEIAEAGGLAPTRAIVVRSVAGEPYERIVGHELGPMPAPCAAQCAESYEVADIPF
jgi:DNA repair protein RadD